MQTGEVAKALGVHYNTAYNLAASGKVTVPKGENGQYDWGQDHLTSAKGIMAERASRTRRPAATPKSAGGAQRGAVTISRGQDAKVLSFLAKMEGKREGEYLHDLLDREAQRVKKEMASILG